MQIHNHGVLEPEMTTTGDGDGEGDTDGSGDTVGLSVGFVGDGEYDSIGDGLYIGLGVYVGPVGSSAKTIMTPSKTKAKAVTSITDLRMEWVFMGVLLSN